MSNLDLKTGRTRMRPEKPLPVVFGILKTELENSERRLFENFNPFGLILFKRNCDNPEQVRRLIREFRLAVGREDAPVFIDQEGGRVSRLQPPNWQKYSPARLFGLTYKMDPSLAVEAIKLHARIMAHDLHSLGITVNCAPVIDLYYKDGSAAIGDRAISKKPEVVAELARAEAETFLENGIIPVIKHFPGHGRLRTDPHTMTSVIDATLAELEALDFVPFELLKDLPVGMNSHAIFTALDPHNPASISPYVQHEIIRGRLGYGGLMLSDDINMKALKGTAGDIARKVQAAGSDIVLHCDGNMEDMLKVVHALQPMEDEVTARWERAKSMVKQPMTGYHPRLDIERLDILLGGVAFDGKSVV